jgi:hypothetical protein
MGMLRFGLLAGSFDTRSSNVEAEPLRAVGCKWSVVYGTVINRLTESNKLGCRSRLVRAAGTLCVVADKPRSLDAVAYAEYFVGGT